MIVIVGTRGIGFYPAGVATMAYGFDPDPVDSVIIVRTKDGFTVNLHIQKQDNYLNALMNVEVGTSVFVPLKPMDELFGVKKS